MIAANMGSTVAVSVKQVTSLLATDVENKMMVLWQEHLMTHIPPATTCFQIAR